MSNVKAEQPVQRRRRLRWWLLLPTALVLLGFYWLLFSANGLSVLLGSLGRFLPETLQIADVSGRLVGPLRIGEITYSDASTHVTISSIDVDWQPSDLFWNDAILIDYLHVKRVVVHSTGNTETSTDSVALEAIPFPQGMSAPIDLRAQRVRVEDIRYSDPSQEVMLGSLELSGSWLSEALTIDHLVLAGELADVVATARVGTGGAHAVALDLQHTVRASQVAQVDGQLTLRGEWDDLSLRYEAKSPYGVSIDVSLLDLSKKLRMSGDVGLDSVSLQQIADDLPRARLDLQAKLDGGFSQLGVLATAAYLDESESNLPRLDARSSLSITPSQLDIAALTLSVGEQSAPVEIDGLLSWANEVTGELRVAWQSLSFPLPDGARADSRGDLHIRGWLNDYQLELEGLVSVAGVDAPLSAVASGGSSYLDLASLSIGVGEALISGSGRLGWGSDAERPPGSLTLSARNVDPAFLAPRLSGLLSADVELSVAGSSPDLEFSVANATVSGELNGQPLQVEIAGGFSEGTISVQQFDASYASSTVGAQGVLGSSSELAFEFASPDLAALALLAGTAASGSLTTRGRIEGSLDSPRLIGELSAAQVVWSGYQVGEIELTADAGLEADAPFDFTIAASDLRLAGNSIDALKLVSSGTAANHDLSLDVAATYPNVQATVHANAGWRDDKWQFESDLVRATLASQDESRLVIAAEPFSGYLAADSSRVDELCLVVARPAVSNAGLGEVPAVTRDATVCGSVTVAGSSVSSSLDIAEFDLGLIGAWLPRDMRLTGVVSGSVLVPDDLAGTTASLVWQSPSIAFRDGAKWLDPVRFDDSSLEVVPRGEDLFASISFPGERQRLLVTSLFTPLADAEFSQWPLQADVELELPRLGFLASLSPLVQALKGHANGSARVTGSVANPVLTADLELELPSVTLAEPSLVLRETRLRLTTENDTVLVEAGSHSGTGQLKLLGRLFPEDQWRFEAAVSGENFRVSDSAQARVDVSPAIELSVNDNLLTLSGQLDVPLADITLAQLPEGAVTVSPDQVIVSDSSEERATALAVSADLKLTLGENVTFSGLGLNASFGGSLQIRERPGRATSATGEVLIRQGSYQAYGQDLTIERGRLLFAGGAIDSPGLDVRAARQATPEVRVGVDVRGSLKTPELTVFSDPSMPSSDQIAYLVLGRPLSGSSSEEQSALRQAALALGVRGGRLVTDRLGEQLAVDTIGIESAPGAGNDQAALVIGKYLTPKLYVSYGYGLFEPISTLRLEYQLNRLWRVVTESSNEATGGDIEWVMEK